MNVRHNFHGISLHKLNQYQTIKVSLSSYSINHFDRHTPMDLARWRYRMHGYEGHTHYTTQTRHQKEQSKTTKAKKIFIERKLNLHPDSISKPINLFDRRTPHLLMK